MGRGTPSPGTPAAPTGVARLGAACTAGMAATVAVARLTEASPERYSAVVIGAVVVGSLAAAVGMWRTDSFEARLAAVLLASLTVGGQVLVATVGGPAATDAHWYPAAFVVVVLGAAVPLLVALDARVRARSAPLVHPYAL